MFLRSSAQHKKRGGKQTPKFLIERDSRSRKAITSRSAGDFPEVLLRRPKAWSGRAMGSKLRDRRQGLASISSDEAIICHHAGQGGFPVNRISEIKP